MTETERKLAYLDEQLARKEREEDWSYLVKVRREITQRADRDGIRPVIDDEIARST